MEKVKILIVDDRVENLMTLESVLESRELEIVRALSGEEALAHVLDHDFALVLLDVNMPGMDGYEVAELMRSNRKSKSIPIIFVTADVQTDHHLFKGYESGAVDYLFKPLNNVVLQSKINVFIELYRQRAELKQKTLELDMKIVELEELQQQLEEVNEQLKFLSITDGLTGLFNKRHFEALLVEEWSRAYRNQSPLSLILLDVDHFKAYNDNYGHIDGDKCLKQVSSVLATSIIRISDKVARVGGEEFAVLLPDTSVEGARIVAERFMGKLEERAIPHESSTIGDKVTASVGISSLIPENIGATNELFHNADQALYEAKSSGRNRLHIWT